MPCPFHLENPRKISGAGWPAQRALFVFALIAVLGLARNAAGSAQLSLSSNSLSFGDVTVGTSSALGEVLTNTGTRSVRVSQDAVKGAGFSISGLSLPLTLSPNEGIAFEVIFAPTAIGSATGSISFMSSAFNSRLSISLSGTGVGQPSASVSPTTLAFGNEAVGSTTTAQTVTLSNTGSAALSLTSIALAGTDPSDFAQSNNCGTSVAAGANCTISVTFTPAASGSLTATVTLADNATGSPQTVTLSGTGTAASTSPAVSLSPTSVSFGNEPIDVASSSQTITLDNTGTAALSITSIAITGTNASDFAEIADTCGSSVAAGANCTIGVTFTPSVASSETASVTITDNASSSPQAVPLSGTGTHDVILSWTASATSGVAGYDVYRGTTSGGESATPLNSSPVAGTSYTDTSVQAGQTYYYVITAQTSSGTQSADSNEVSVTVP